MRAQDLKITSQSTKGIEKSKVEHDIIESSQTYFNNIVLYIITAHFLCLLPAHRAGIQHPRYVGPGPADPPTANLIHLIHLISSRGAYLAGGMILHCKEHE